MTRDELINRINGEDDEDNNSTDDLFNDINNEEDNSDNSDDNLEDDLYNDINNDDNDEINDDFTDTSDDENDSVDASSIGLGKLKKVQLSNKSILLGFGAVTLVILLIVGLIAFIVIHNNKPPVAQIVHIESNNLSDKSIARYGTQIIISFLHTWLKNICWK